MVLATAQLPLDLGPLLAGHSFWCPEQEEFSRRDLLERLASAEALISLLDVSVDGEMFDVAPNLKVVANYAVGFDNIDIAEASRRGIVVANTPDVLTEATADLAFALLLAAARRIGEGERLVREGAWRGWAPSLLLGKPVHGARLGVVGAGRIGRAVLRRGRGFSMDLLYCAPRAVREAEDLGAVRGTIEQLLEQCDFISLHCPGGEATHHLIDAGALARMRPGAILVNTARGSCVDENALTEALAEGLIAGAGLDVFAQEPIVSVQLRECPSVVLAPHLGSATQRAREQMARLCAAAVVSVLSGQRPVHALNWEATR